MHRRQLLHLAAGLATVVMLGCSSSTNAGTSDAKLKTLTVDEVAAKIAAKDGKTYIFDDNEKDSWVKGHVPGAKWLDEDKVTAADLPADKAAFLIFYCHDEG
ncbi:MAG TPA: rhodanese-like domain-containing protein [Kofleriaceae bacterium]|nr:rhodanese-like domain-containing protein [Kofleriaceae bacterium]